MNLDIEDRDVNNAFLYGGLDTPILMEQSIDWIQEEAVPGHVWKLLKSLYDTKEAGEIWGSHLDNRIKPWGFKSSKYDDRIYFLKRKQEFITISIVVDNLAFSS